MAMASHLIFPALCHLILFTITSEISPPFFTAATQLSFQPHCPPGFVVFGDSLSDTGNLLHLTPSLVASGNPPYGRTFFDQPTGRFSDGRLVVDFFAEAFRYPFLHPYLDSIGADFRHGINFAFAGSSANVTVVSPFTVSVQVDEFTQFKREALQKRRSSLLAIPKSSFFSDALYIVGEIGENDLRYAILNLNQTTVQVESAVIPRAVATIVNSANKLYKQGARNFMFVSILAQGCSAFTITVFGRNDPDELDSLGCLKSFNNLVQVFNSHLRLAVDQLKMEIPDATIVFADYYNASLEIFSNPSKYGSKLAGLIFSLFSTTQT